MAQIIQSLPVNSFDVTQAGKIVPFCFHSCNSNKFVKIVYIFFLLPFFLYAQSISIIPLPKSFVKGEGQFQLNSNTIVGTNDTSLLPQANYLQTELRKANGWTIPLDQNEALAAIDLQLTDKKQLPAFYTLKIEPQKITIQSSGNEGMFLWDSFPAATDQESTRRKQYQLTNR